MTVNINDLVKIGSVAKPHGIKGEFTLYAESDFPEWLAKQQHFYADHNGGLVQWRVERARMHKGRLVLKVDALPDRTAVDNARGVALYLPEEQARGANNDPDYFFNYELIGLEVMDHGGGAVFGKVVDVLEMPGQNLLKVAKPDHGSFMVPFVEAMIVEVDAEAGLIRVSLPENLIEINKKQPKETESD